MGLLNAIVRASQKAKPVKTHLDEGLLGQVATKSNREKILPYVGTNKPLENYMEYVHVDDLEKLFKDYGATYSDKGWANLEKSIKSEGGLTEPIIIQVGRKSQSAELSEGHHRLKKAKEMGYEYLPTTVMMSDDMAFKHLRKDVIPSADDSVFHPSHIGEEWNPNWRGGQGIPSDYLSDIRVLDFYQD